MTTTSCLWFDSLCAKPFPISPPPAIIMYMAPPPRYAFCDSKHVFFPSCPGFDIEYEQNRKYFETSGQHSEYIRKLDNCWKLRHLLDADVAGPDVAHGGKHARNGFEAPEIREERGYQSSGKNQKQPAPEKAGYSLEFRGRDNRILDDQFRNGLPRQPYPPDLTGECFEQYDNPQDFDSSARGSHGSPNKHQNQKYLFRHCGKKRLIDVRGPVSRCRNERYDRKYRLSNILLQRT